MTGHRFDLGPTRLQRGGTLPDLQIVYQTYGTLSPARDNLILYPTSYGAHHTDIEWLIGPGRVLDPQRYFIVIPNQLGNGLSTSPSLLETPFDAGRAPIFTHWDNVHAQDRLLREVFSVERPALIYGWSMGGQQALHWGALFPDRVDRIVATCTSARTSPHNRLFLDSLRAALTADRTWVNGRFEAEPIDGLRAFARIYASWALSQDFYRERLWEGLGFASLEDFLVRFWEWNYRRRAPEDLLSMLETWAQSDISDNAVHGGDLDAALGAIRARTILLPSTTDLYFTRTDTDIEAAKMPHAEVRPIPSIWGHRAGNPITAPEDEAVLAQAVRDILAE